MVLKTNSLPAQTATARPAFEAMDDDTVSIVSTVAQADTTSANAAPAAATPAATTPTVATPAAATPAAEAANPAPVAVRPANAVVVSTTSAAAAFKAEVEAMKGAIDFSFGNYPSFKPAGGKLKCKEPVASLGSWVRGTMIGWNNRVQVSPGEGKPKDLVAYSDDCVTISKVIGEAGADWEGRPVAEYLLHLRGDQGCNLAKASTYVDVAFAVAECESNLKEFIGEVVQIVLSPSSATGFTSYQSKLTATAICVEKRLPGFKLPEDPFNFYFQVEDAVKGDKEWQKLKVLAKLPTKA